jgi:hypothetical protein
MPSEQGSAGAGNIASGGAAAAGTEGVRPAPRIDVEKVAEKVYELMRRDLLREKERRGGELNA